ncbi:energy transducer TonB [Novosphingobium tardum]|uniref:Energy transducer TonB n=1 Tax=Novosphingobium tardum TaxID=1538021 RepID=A0ABV8RST7_9SPHN
MNSVAQWSSGMTDKINQNLELPRRVLNESTDGTVSVAFLCSEDGTPAALRVIHRSGNSTLDRAALRAVSRIPTMHPLPQGIDHGQRFQANIIFASSQSAYDDQIRTLRRDAARTSQALAAQGDTLVLNVTANPRG